jgi:hypothetical protein
MLGEKIMYKNHQSSLINKNLLSEIGRARDNSYLRPDEVINKNVSILIKEK